MKNLKFLMFLPIMALTACGGSAAKGQEVDQKKAQEVAANIAKTQKEVKSVEFSMQMSDYDAEDKVTSSGVYTYKLAENGDIYCCVSGGSHGDAGGDSSSSTSLYKVKNDKYEEVFFYESVTKSKDEKEATTTTYCLGKKDNETIYTTTTASMGTSTINMTKGIYDGFANPATIIAEAVIENETGYKVKFYASGNNNLTIEAKLSRDKQASESDNLKKASAVYTYTNGYFSSFEMENEYFDGSNIHQKCEAKYNKVSISLPSGWESQINKSLLG